MVIQASGFRTLKKTKQRKFWEYMRCSRYRRYKEHGCVKHTPIQYGELRNFIIERLRAEISKGVNIEGSINSNVKKRMVDTEKELQQLEKKNSVLLDLYLDERISKEEFSLKKDTMEAHIHELKNSLLTMKSEVKLSDQIASFSGAIKRLNANRKDLNEVFRTFIHKIIIHPDGVVDIEFAFTPIEK